MEILTLDVLTLFPLVPVQIQFKMWRKKASFSLNSSPAPLGIMCRITLTEFFVSRQTHDLPRKSSPGSKLFLVESLGTSQS